MTMITDHRRNQIEQLPTQIESALANADKLNLIDVGIRLDQARLATEAAISELVLELAG